MKSQIQCVSCGRTFWAKMRRVKGVTPKLYLPEENQCQSCRNFLTMTKQNRKPQINKVEDNDPRLKEVMDRYVAKK